jgi:hypothetical protein
MISPLLKVAFRMTLGCERSQQGVDLGCSPADFPGHQQPVKSLIAKACVEERNLETINCAAACFLGTKGAA